jgi:two-component system, cell cycle response regulator
LLARLGRRVGDLARPGISAYRMGGDEFCMLAALEADGAEIVAQASEALSEHGEAFSVGCSYGTVVIPTEASTPSDALRVSDGRMYRVKAVRGATTRESIDVLLKVLEESNGELVGHLRHVAEFAAETARDLGLDELEVSRVQAAAELHDIGKSAIPRSILDKPGELDAAEWRFMRQHTLIGERIAQAAPSLANVAELIRSTHERFDGKGYPDGLAGESIPLGARIIAVCDAYDAMTSERPYSPRLASDEALKELRRCAGDQFDPKVVKAFAWVAERLGGAGNGAPPRPRSEAGGDAGEGDGQVEEVVGVVDRDEAEDV